MQREFHPRGAIVHEMPTNIAFPLRAQKRAGIMSLFCCGWPHPVRGTKPTRTTVRVFERLANHFVHGNKPKERPESAVLL